MNWPNTTDRSIALADHADLALKAVAEEIGHPNWYQLYKYGDVRKTRTMYHDLLVKELRRLTDIALRGEKSNGTTDNS
jgi:hypothetical protein